MWAPSMPATAPRSRSCSRRSPARASPARSASPPLTTPSASARGGEPSVQPAESNAQQLAVDPIVAVLADAHCLRHHAQHILRHHALVERGLADVAEGIERQAMRAGTDALDVGLEAHVRDGLAAELGPDLCQARIAELGGRGLVARGLGLIEAQEPGPIELDLGRGRLRCHEYPL